MTGILNIKDLKYGEGHCGEIKKLFESRRDISLVYLKVDEAREHYHKITTEFYFVVRGSGKVKLDDKIREICEGNLVEISPNTRHKAFDENGLEILVIMVPPLEPTDNYFV